MTNDNLTQWLNRDANKLVKTFKLEVSEHISKINAKNGEFYGYAILPGTSYSVDNLVAAFNQETDLSPEHKNDTYYRYSVDEWENYEQNQFRNTNKILDSLNSQFQELHVKENPNNFVMDELKIAYINKLHEAILKALLELRRDGIFGNDNNFVVIWIPDSDEEIIFRSAKVLNSVTVYDRFISEFGD